MTDHGSGTVAENGHVARVPAESMHVALNPLERKQYIPQALIARGRFVAEIEKTCAKMEKSWMIAAATRPIANRANQLPRGPSR